MSRRIPPEGRRDEKTEQRVGERCVEVRVRLASLKTHVKIRVCSQTERCGRSMLLDHAGARVHAAHRDDAYCTWHYRAGARPPMVRQTPGAHAELHGLLAHFPLSPDDSSGVQG